MSLQEDINQEGYYIFPKKDEFKSFGLWFISKEKVDELQSTGKLYLSKDLKKFEGSMEEVKAYIESHEEIGQVFVPWRYVK